MKRRILSGVTVIILLMVVVLNIVSAGTLNKDNGFETLNPLIDVGDEIYVQHDADNNNVYDL